ncbi:hypothetical protein [Methylocystis echinoides]|uniref:Transmembrane protein n=1 Tax=Methylocystis echinoides TaxID=29468 RepID=A0A9W6GZ61_9HYPH|nr:hypothetical protein [Methylocystis echinoides]GLI95786.1 hypothetical protein LMG27198_47780 [Methylocystis echinoides]
MKPITPSAHGYLDYVTVAVFLLAPKLLGFDGLPALLSWTLAGVHLALTLVTDFPLGWRPWLPFWIHGWIERIVGPALVLVAFLVKFSEGGSAFGFYLLMGLVIIAVGWLTDYSGGTKQALRPSL